MSFQSEQRWNFPGFHFFDSQQSLFYSAPSIFAVLRNLVWEIWFEKSGSRNLVREIWFEISGSRIVVGQKKRWFHTIDLAFFRLEKSGWPEKKIRVCRTTFLKPDFSNQISRTWFLEPDFSNQISKNCKKWGRRLKGCLDCFYSHYAHNDLTEKT